MKKSLNSFLKARSVALNEIGVNRAKRVTNVAAFCGIALLGVVIVLYAALNASAFRFAILIDAVAVLGLVAVLLLNRSGHFLAASILMNLSVSLPVFLNEKLFFGYESGYHSILILCAFLPAISVATRRWWLPLSLALLDAMFFVLSFRSPPLFDLTAEMPRVALSEMNDIIHLLTVLGVISAINVFQIALSRTESSLAAKAVVLSETLEEVNRLANHDALTGLMNRRHVESRIQLEIDRSERYGLRLSIIMFDLDHFKSINDTFGHEEGDKVLQRAASIAARVVRSSDLAGRWGGEEFIVVLPQTDLDGALATAEKIRQSLNDEIERERMVTGSFGVAEWLPEESFTSFYCRVDEAMYDAKKGGRNRVSASMDAKRRPRPIAHIDWKHDWDSGDQLIDRQHRGLLDLANEIISLSLSTSQREPALALLARILQEIQEHFDYEESVLERIRYSGLDAHRTSHRLLAKRAIELKDEVMRGEAQTISIFVFVLEEVVVGHIQQEDTVYFAELKNSTKK